MTQFPPLKNRDRDQLSAYLDGALAPEDRGRLERRLRAEPALRASLESLQAVKTRLADLPGVQPPRNFTLTQKILEARGLARPARRPGRLIPALNWATALAAALFAVVLAGDLTGMLIVGSGQRAAAPASEAEVALFSEAPAGAADEGAAKATTVTPEAPAPMMAPAAAESQPMATVQAPAQESATEPLTGATGMGGGGGPPVANGVGGGQAEATEAYGLAPAAPEATGGADLERSMATASPEALGQVAATAMPTASPSLQPAGMAAPATATPAPRLRELDAVAASPWTPLRIGEFALGLAVAGLLIASLLVRLRR